MIDPGSVHRHQTVMPNEACHFLVPSPGAVLVDATVGAGGHTRLLAEKVLPGGLVIGVDQDETMLEMARARLTDLPVRLKKGNFAGLPHILQEMGHPRVDGLLADLGICSDQLDESSRGFSFSRPGPLDMRMSPGQGESATDLLRRLPEVELANLIYEYGEERYSRRIARRIVERRKQGNPLTTTEDLAELVRGCVPRGRRRPGERAPIDPATRVFQALRIAVNDELGVLEQLLAELPLILHPGGRAVLISFHSLEDRRVKQTFRNKEVWEELTRKPVTASEEEIATNPRARSAKLRAARLRPIQEGSSDVRREASVWT